MYNKLIFSSIHKIYYYALIAYTLIFSLLLYFYINLPTYEYKFKNIILSQSIEGVDASAERIIDHITDTNGSFLEKNIINMDIRISNESYLEHLTNRHIASVFIVFLDNGKLYYLLDSSKDDKGELGELFAYEDLAVFLKVKARKKREIYIQEGLMNLGFTLIKPIIQENRVVAFMLIDYTQKSLDVLISRFSSFAHLFFKVIISGLLLLLLIGVYFIWIAHLKNRMYKIPNMNVFSRLYLTDYYERINFSNYYIALVDIDLFKRINDIYGHKNGDNVIVLLMKNISSLLSSEDIFIQYGGGEFLLFIGKKRVSVQEFRYLMEDIRMMVETLDIKIDNEMVKMTLSIGAVIETENSGTLQDAIHQADGALYESKHNGRNSVHYFDISDDRRVYRERLKDLINAGKLVCYYQPIIALDDNTIHHYEALLRIEDGNKIIYPDKILPDLEDSYFYSRIGMHVIEYNVKKLREDRDFSVAINLSSDDLLNEAILSLLISSSDISNRMLIEILENKSVDYDKVEISIQKLKLFGYKICIDDFGSGYSNLDHLLNLSIDYLKLDGSLIKNLHYDKKAHSIIQALTLFCQQNEIEVIAEFVENREIVEVLKGFGIEYGQGYYFDTAKPYDELPKKYY